MTDENGTEVDALETDDLGAEGAETPERAETAQETARAVWEELAAKADEADATAKVIGDELTDEALKAKEAEKPNEITEAARKLASQRKSKRQTFVPEGKVAPAADEQAPTTEKYEPPASWEVKDKEWFLSQPPEVQKNAVQWFKNAQAHSTKLWQDMNRETARAKEVVEVLDRHWKDLAIPSNFTKGQVVDQLLQYQKRINEDSVGALLEMMQHRRVSLQDLQARITGQAPSPVRVQQAQPQQNNFLTAEELDARLAAREQALSQQRATQSATEEVNALAREVQGNRYVWPEMHDAGAIQRIQPLVTYFRETNPNASWAELYKKAMTQDRINRGVGSPSSTSPRLTPENIQTVRQASSSLRSRGGNGAIPRTAEPKANESARESAEAAYWEVFGNKQH